ncbi:hypothetical protein FRB97_006965 [Tulasnella sp. 331]|nr:hypothetical protein FRB97_006965 [Tulasnella sp. 331]KAG8888668.1 hypothetical protein FRB98_007229 [Tulasnella sp. 332]
MGPPVAIIVGSTILGVGLVVAIHEAWPYFKPHAQEFLHQCSARYDSFKSRRRRRVQPHSANTSRGPSFNDSERKYPASHFVMDLDDEDISRSVQHRLIEPLSGAALAAEKEGPPAYGLRRRHVVNRDASEETLMDTDLEMVHIDQANPWITCTPMTPTTSRPSSRARATSFDVDPFHYDEPSVPVATAIPLPLSPSSSALSTDRTKATETLGFMTAQSRQSTGVQSFATAPTYQTPQSTSTVSTPNPQSPPPPPSAFSTVRRSRHHTSASQTSIPSAANILSPPTIPTPFEARSPVARAVSPSGVSDTMSLVSAAPSRTWTEGGTADIFSGM